jgi:hypothetical protein
MQSSKIERPSGSYFGLTIGNDRGPCSQRSLKAGKKRSTIAIVIVTMLPLIAGYDHNPALVCLPPRVPWKIGHIATIASVSGLDL